MLLHLEVRGSNSRKRKLCRLWRKRVIRGLQHGEGRIIEDGSHRAARSDAVRRAFSYDGRIIGCKIVYVIFVIVVIA